MRARLTGIAFFILATASLTSAACHVRYVPAAKQLWVWREADGLSDVYHVFVATFDEHGNVLRTEAFGNAAFDASRGWTAKDATIIHAEGAPLRECGGDLRIDSSDQPSSELKLDPRAKETSLDPKIRREGQTIFYLSSGANDRFANVSIVMETAGGGWTYQFADELVLRTGDNETALELTGIYSEMRTPGAPPGILMAGQSSLVVPGKFRLR